MGVANRPGTGRAQGFTSFGPVGDGRIEREDAERFLVPAFVAHIGFGEITEATEGFLINPWWKQLVPAIEIPHLDGSVIPQPLEQAFPNESVWLTDAETPAEAQTEVVVDFLEDHTGAVNVFVKMTVDAINASARLPWFPQRPMLARANEQDRQRAAGVGVPQDLVHGLVGEERVVGINAPCGEWGVAANEQPVIAVADHAHQKGIELVDMANADVGLTIDCDKLTPHRWLGSCVHHEEGFGSCHLPRLAIICIIPFSFADIRAISNTDFEVVTYDNR